MNSNRVLHHYLMKGLEVSELEDYSIKDIHPRSIEDSKEDVNRFLNLAGDLISGLNEEDIGIGFWITRNNSGSGFSNLDETVGKKLAEICSSFPENGFYIVDDNKLYIE